MALIAERLVEVRQRIDAAATAVGRDPAAVRLLAVSKRHGPEAIREAYAAGQRDFGENYAQELRDKAAALADLPEIRWHFIGRLQTNKAKYVAPASWLVHAIDDVAQAQALVARSEGRAIAGLVAVNVAGEATKGGVTPESALPLCRALVAVPGFALRGLMTMPPPTDDPEDAAPSFARLAALAAEGRATGLPLDELSMGMTDDFPVAVRHGATWLRIGTAIFGPRS